MKKLFLSLAAALMLLVPSSAPAAVRFGGRVFVGGGYWGAPYWGGYWGPYYGYGPYWGGYYAYPNSGQIKLDTKVKDAQVFINGAFAGTTHENKTMHLRPGSYNLEIREGGRTQFAEKVYVAAGKTLHLHPEL
ncbi:MAG TPA: PEGA domain-containing protein [Bryobacteraceae bacterium]|nr:PEGA domain-containing protein [Bryobacteraceae bacterium]